MFERLNVLYEKNWTRLVTEQLKRFERAVVESGNIDGGTDASNAHWTLGGALLYTLTLLTTVGYSRLSPRTAIGKVAAIMYAIIGVPLMLVLLSVLGSMFASCATKGYLKVCCKVEKSRSSKSAVGYHKAPSSPSGKHHYHPNEDSASIQMASTHNTPNHVSCKSNHQGPTLDRQEIPKRAILATVRATHARGRCRQGPVRQLLADPSLCPAHSHYGSPIKNSILVSSTLSSEMEEAEDTDENDHSMCAHDTPSRIPLIWKPPDDSTDSLTPSPSHHSPSVPTTLVLLLFVSYICIGAAALVSISGWSFLDAAYFCFLALSTIGIGDKLPQNPDMHTQLQLLACCAYLFLGLVLVAMCFSLVQDEITMKCKQIASNIGYLKH